MVHGKSLIVAAFLFLGLQQLGSFDVLFGAEKSSARS